MVYTNIGGTDFEYNPGLNRYHSANSWQYRLPYPKIPIPVGRERSFSSDEVQTFDPETGRYHRASWIENRNRARGTIRSHKKAGSSTMPLTGLKRYWHPSDVDPGGYYAQFKRQRLTKSHFRDRSTRVNYAIPRKISYGRRRLYGLRTPYFGRRTKGRRRYSRKTSRYWR